MSIKLQDLVTVWIDTQGEEKAIAALKESLDKEYSHASINNWRNGNANTPMPVIQYILDQSKVEFKVENGEPFTGANMYIGMIARREVSLHTFKATHVLRYKYKDLGLLLEVGSYPPLQRNRLVDRFLKTDAEWLLMLDDDMAPPIGYPNESAKWGAKFEPKFNSQDVIQRLMSHQKTLVSAMYFTRDGRAIPMYAEGRNDEKVAADDRLGPVDAIKTTDWVGSGCCLVHRKVYEDMLEKLPDIRKPHEQAPNGWYNPLPNAGEDVSFALRAKQIGHQPYVDRGCVCGHVGQLVHFNEKIR